jgi:hypothetical protein
VVSIKLVRPIKIPSSETYSKFRRGKYLCDVFYIQNDLQELDALTPLLFIFTLGYAIRKAQESQMVLKLNETCHHLLSICICCLVDRMQRKIIT